MVRNPVMFVVEVVAAPHHASSSCATSRPARANLGFSFQIILWLWFTVLFANFAEAIAEGRGKAQAASLTAQPAPTSWPSSCAIPTAATPSTSVPALSLASGDVVSSRPATSSPPTARSSRASPRSTRRRSPARCAPVIRESGGDRSAVTGGTQVLSDWIKVRITAAPGSTFLDRMIGLVEGAERQKTPNEIALNILLVGLTLIFVFAVASIPSFAAYAGGAIGVIAWSRSSSR